MALLCYNLEEYLFLNLFFHTKDEGISYDT